MVRALRQRPRCLLLRPAGPCHRPVRAGLRLQLRNPLRGQLFGKAEGAALGILLGLNFFSGPQSLFRANEPGFHFETYDPNTLLRRRNFAYASEDVTVSTTNLGWSKSNLNASITTGVSSYDGLPIAQTVSENTANGQHVYFGNTTWFNSGISPAGYTPGEEIVFEGEFKYAGRQVLLFVTNSGFTNAFNARFDLQTGQLVTSAAIGSGASVVSTNITDLGNGWYRCRVRGKLTASGDTSVRCAVYLHNGTVDTYTGDGVSGVTATRHKFMKGSVYDSDSSYQKVTDWYTEYRAAALSSITMWQDVLGGTPVTAVEQTVGGWLDTRLGVEARGPQIWDTASVSFTGEATQVSPGVYRIYSSAGALSEVYKTGANALTIGKWYEVIFTIDSITTLGAGVRVGQVGPAFTTVGTHKFKFQADGASANVKRASSACDIQVSNISYQEVLGNHGAQATAGSRPVLSARYNLFDKTEQPADASWTKTAATATNNVVAASNGTITAGSLIETTANDVHQLARTVTVAAGAEVVFEIEAKQVNATQRYLRLQISSDSGANGCRVLFNLATGAIAIVGQAFGTGTFVSASSVATSNGFYKLTLRGKAAAAATAVSGNYFMQDQSASYTATYTGDGAAGMYVWGMSMRYANDTTLSQPAYQRVNTSTDYDTDGFVHYLRFDGTDDYLVTPAIDFSGVDKVTVWGGLTKLADTAAAIVCELGTAAVAGEFGMLAPTGASPSFGFRTIGSSGDANAATVSNSAHAAPMSAIVTGIGSISDDQRVIRINGVQQAVNSVDQGSGNLANAAVFIGRRNGSSLPANIRLTNLTGRGSTTPTSEAFISAMNRYAARIAGQTNVTA